MNVGCDVFANSNEVACKAGEGKVIAAFPDVCLSPPSPPAGPIPIPYPNTSFDKDMQSGSKTVVIKGKEVMLKDQSFYKSSPLGDEAATNSFGASVVTHVITGKTYFKAWSMDVQFEGQNVDRNLDLTGSNAASDPTSTPPVMPNASAVSPPEDYKATPGGGKKDRHPCTDKGESHAWECDPPGKKSCAQCWEPPCDDNHKRDQEAYEAKQSGSGQDKINAQKAENQTLIDKAKAGGHDASGHEFENAMLDKVDPDTVESVGYKAHCTKCHTEGDLDIVTKDRVIECKKSAKAIKADQLKENIKPIASQCHPGKQVTVAVPAAVERDAKNKVGQKSFKAAAGPGDVDVIDP
jgi:Domain of unknown function (DUF4150)